MSRVKLTFESWDEFWSSGGEALVQAEYDEHKNSRHLKPLLPHHEIFRSLSLNGQLYLLVARLLGRPIGYLMVTMNFDLESAQSLIAQQGPLYVLPDCAELGLGASMLNEMFGKLRAHKIEEIELHHPVDGRGAKLKSLFSRLGAKPCNSTYLLSLEPL